MSATDYCFNELTQHYHNPPLAEERNHFTSLWVLSLLQKYEQLTSPCMWQKFYMSSLKIVFVITIFNVKIWLWNVL